MSHYKPYPAYKDSGVEWLGQVPEHWTIGPYKATIQIENGSDYKEVESDDGYPVIGSGGPFAYSSKRMYDGESVLLGRKGTIDKPLYVNGAFWAVDTMYWSIIKPGAHGRFAYYIATTIPFDMYSTNTALPSMTKSVLGSHLVAFPGFEEQQVIANHLDRETARIDALVAKKTRFIELLREKRQALITHAVTKGLDPNVKMKDSGVEWLGEVPEHWEVKRLKFVATVQTGIAKGKDNADKDTVEIPYLRVANVQDGYLDLDEVATLEVSSADLSRYLLQPGDVLMNEGGDFDKLGRGHVWHGQIDPCIHQNHVFAVRPHSVRPEWLNAYTSSSAAQFYFMGRSKQSTNLASISSSNLMELPVPLPGDDEQCQILQAVQERASRLDGLLAKTNRSIVLLKERRAALVTAAITGQIDLREAV
ncbi:restriction endonuclease subunit S [Pseudomonas aeruginosa]|uniref:Restriction endonuclease subunit S n=1 Tax=Stutzerimonas marianensis TaxID=2929513 RepID=A0A9X2AWQ6_9GAMM|nr:MULTISPECIES: restriction endonuclease subunit S [Pseudomonas]WGL65192.1 restriction endonuclease subunit S [Pseudomonas sp. CW003PS]MCJ0975771.1 restriction endonuclease subunit S [Pseudomonas marianensis]MCJ0975787.1 restriction endonuclease subunit S [Pseudomonas marianensis]MCT5425176.1 restriction endonuclease subunit S [Pseudomonas aeruginosa]HBN8445690.1 restriction endonuclease subunit S [Pseudomonas aeruginosa]